MLNADQRRVFDTLEAHLRHQQRHENGECSCALLKPLRMFVSGVGGTGKSFLIQTVRGLVDQLWPSNDLMCAVAAPTGLAAFNVGGITIHRLFQLPVEHEGKTATYWSLPKSSQKVLQTTLRSVKMIVIDEVSMVSSLNFAYMHLRLEELFGGNDWFGATNMLFVGDLLQLLPVNGAHVFERITQRSLQYRLGCTTAVNIWREAVVYDELTINERQKTDDGFSMLDSVRRGCPNDETILMLRKRVIEGSVADKFVELQRGGLSPVCLFPKRKACESFNDEMLGRLPSRLHRLKNYYVYREQYPLILAYAVTIHKCQGLSLDCAIVDLSQEVFSDGMAYVAISRVRTLAWLHLVAFQPSSIMVSATSLKEVNRL